jgi:hypothetical protein
MMSRVAKTATTIALGMVLFAARIARADAQDDLKDAEHELSNVAADLNQLRAFSGNHTIYSVVKCHKYVDVLRKGGVKTIKGMWYENGKKVDATNYEISLGQADELCDEFGRWLVVGNQYGAINFAYDQVAKREAGPNAAADCKSALAAIRATGLRDDVRFNFGFPKGTLSDLDKQICVPLGPIELATAEAARNAPPPRRGKRGQDDVPRTAAPEDTPSSREVTKSGEDVGKYVTARQELIDDIAAFGQSGRRLPETADCLGAVDRARKTGAKQLTNDAFKSIGTATGNTYAITIDRAGQVCSDYAPYETIAKEAGALDFAQADAITLKPETGYSAAGLQVFIDGKKCRAAADAIASAKLPPSLPFHIRGGGNGIDVTVGDVKQKVCEHISQVARDILGASAAADKKDTERFTKYGIAGDRLDLLKKNWGFLFLPGGRSSNDVKTYASAPIIFEWTTSDPDDADMVTHTVRRYQFKSNKLVNTTEKTYRKRKGDKLGDVFR